MFWKYHAKCPWKKCAVIVVLKWAFFKSLTLSGVLVTTPGQYLGSCIEIKKNINFWALLIPKHKSSIKLGNILL